ncbi:hypothetical protein C4559_02360 [Candidatus Microgenomates bacterium]|nr:MAG: hypothetical protein C4559_02360 [Candidatus Microgenomates bacterium]
MVRTTINHKEIMEWAKKHRGKPQIIDDPTAGSDTPGIRINFPGIPDDVFLSETKIRDISWNEFFKEFDDNNLAFVYMDEIVSNDPDSLSRAYRFINRDDLEGQKI